jgi:alpha-beta hydrolase superfamily lysophospholipase
MLGFTMRLVVGLIALAILAIGIAWFLSQPDMPGAFYRTALPAAAKAGDLLASEPFAQGLPAGAAGWRIAYATTRHDGRPALATALVLAPAGGAAREAKIVAWAHGTTGIAPGCAPSLQTDPFANAPALAEAIAEGWVIVATDYAGLGAGDRHGYLVGDDAARSVLDSVRAAQRVSGLSLSADVVIWGHSQGGHSALWSRARQAALAPDLSLRGVAALAPASDLPALLSGVRGTMFGKIVSAYALLAYAEIYPDIRVADYTSAWTRWITRDIGSRCVGGPATLFSVAMTYALPADGLFARDPLDGPLGVRLTQNVPPSGAAPLLLAQGTIDDLVLPDIQTRFVATRCAAGDVIDYRLYADRDHLSLVAPGSPLIADLVAFTRDRFAGAPLAAGLCHLPD